MADDRISEVAVVMVPLPAQGHLNQLLHLSRLVSAAGLPVFYVGSATHIRQAKHRVHGSDQSAAISNINFHEFPTPSFPNPQPDPHAPIKFPSQLDSSFAATVALRDPILGFVDGISGNYRRIVVIYDFLMAYVVQDLDSVRNAESYCFWSLSAFSIYFFRWRLAGMPDIPGEAGSIMKEMRGWDGFFSPEFKEFSSLQRGCRKNITRSIHNSSRIIEGLYLDLMAEGETNEPDKQFVIGPFNPVETNRRPEKNDSRIRHKCLDWLDNQELDSVILVSFGTTSSFPDEQIRELAIGLEKSRQKFVWVLRDADKGDIFTGETRKPRLPDGFEERAKERGMVVRDWAPQLEILGHVSTGGFMSHCGWNSCMESISMGVPIAAWPMHSDQPANAVLVTRVLGIGVEVRDWGSRDEVVSSSVVEDAVRILMGSIEGEEMRRRAKELGDDVKSSVKESGISNKEMKSFITHISR
ncbi:hypothetical protein OROHE_011566 [Orobanche hederae]